MPTIALIGRPNVGKSTLFNRLVGQRKAIVEDFPGTTRDRLYGQVEWNGITFNLIDTGGVVVEPGETEKLASITRDLIEHVKIGISEADLIVFLVDGRDGLTSEDHHALELIRKSGKPVMLAVNKLDDIGMYERLPDFYSLGLGEPVAVSALSGRGSGDLLDVMVERLLKIFPDLSGMGVGYEPSTVDRIRVAIVGRPNVGKSTLLNALYGVKRSIVSDVPGTTRDAIDVEFTYLDKSITLVDTAGIRKRGKVEQGIEHYSVLRAEQAVDRSDIALVLIDASEGLTSQDTHIIGYVHEHHKSLIIVANKWDIVRTESQELKGPQDAVVSDFTHLLMSQLDFVRYAPILTLSALTGLRVNKILDMVLHLQSQRFISLTPKQVKDIIKPAVMERTPSSKRGMFLRFFTYEQTGVNPPTFEFTVNDTELIHFSYERYLVNRIREVFPFEGTPIRMIFKQGERKPTKKK